MRHRILAAAVAAALVVSVGTRATAVGTIDTTDATIATGAAPTQGTVTIDPAAPFDVLPALPAIPEPGAPPVVSGSMPTAPSFGDGSGGAFSATTGTVPLAPGTHQFTTFDITNGATVTLSGATTILVQNAVSIAGSLTSTASGAGITIRCGGDFALVSRSPASLVQTTGTNSPIEIVSGGNMMIGTGVNNLDAQVNATLSNIVLDAYGNDQLVEAIRIQSGQVLAPAGSITARCNGWFSVGGILSTRPGVVACAGPLWVRSFAGQVVNNSNGTYTVTAGAATLEALDRVFVGGTLALNGTGAATFVSTNGPCDLSGNVQTTDGDVVVRTGGRADLRDQEVSAGGTGSISVTAGGLVRFRGAPVQALGGDVDVVAGEDILMQGSASLVTQAALRVSTSGGDFRMFDTSSLLQAATATVRVAGDVFIGEGTPPEKLPSNEASVDIDVGAFDLSAGGFVILDANTSRSVGEGGAFKVLCNGDLTVAGTIRARGDIVLQSQNGDIDVLGVSLLTTPMTEDGAIRVETWKPAGRIDAADSTIVSGSSEGQSGDVDVLVHDPAATVVDAFILPKVVRVKLKGDGKDKLKAVGVFDDGGRTVDYGEPVTIRVGEFERTFTLQSNPKGTAFKFKGDDVLFKIQPNRGGSSRGLFVLVISKTTLAGLVDPEEPLEMQFSGTGLPDAGGTFGLTNGGFRIGRTRGTLIAPEFFPTLVKAKVGDGKPDKLKFKGGFRTDGPVPESLTNVVLAVGGEFRLTVPGSEFTRTKDRFLYRSTADGVSIRLFVDFGRELVQIVTKGAELGDLSGATTDIEFDAGDGRGAVRSTIRLGSNGAKRGY